MEVWLAASRISAGVKEARPVSEESFQSGRNSSGLGLEASNNLSRLDLRVDGLVVVVLGGLAGLLDCWA